jgi:hypothetical protein
MRCDQILHFYDTWNVFQIIDEILVEVMKMTPFNNSSWQKAQFCQKQGFNLTIDDIISVLEILNKIWGKSFSCK